MCAFCLRTVRGVSQLGVWVPSLLRLFSVAVSKEARWMSPRYKNHAIVQFICLTHTSGGGISVLHTKLLPWGDYIRNVSSYPGPVPGSRLSVLVLVSSQWSMSKSEATKPVWCLWYEVPRLRFRCSMGCRWFEARCSMILLVLLVISVYKPLPLSPLRRCVRRPVISGCLMEMVLVFWHHLRSYNRCPGTFHP